MNKSPLTLAIISALAFGPSTMTQASETQASDGFVEGSSLKILNRNFYFNRDFRKGEARVLPNGERSSYTEAWTHGILANFESGFTQGTVGFGVDLHAGLGLKLDTGDGRYGPGGSVDMLPVDSDDRAEDAYSKDSCHFWGSTEANLFRKWCKISPYVVVFLSLDLMALFLK